MAETIALTLIVDDKGTAIIKDFAQGADRQVASLSRSIKRKLGQAFSGLAGMTKSVLRGLTSMKGLIAGIGVGLLAREAVNVAAGFERMQISLDTITKGEGASTFKELNEWALRMPISTQGAIKAFINMRAMGLQPTIAEMTTLVDTVGALGGESDSLLRIARALGQIQTKGRVSSEELLQLAEAGIPVFEILKDRYGDVAVASLNAGEAIKTLMEGMEERFGGQSEKMQKTWTGMVTTIKSFINEFIRLVGEAGLFEVMKSKLVTLQDWMVDAFNTGQMQDFAKVISGQLSQALEGAWNWAKMFYEEIGKAAGALDRVKTILTGIEILLKGIALPFSLIGKALGNVAGFVATQGESGLNEARRGGALPWDRPQPPSIAPDSSDAPSVTMPAGSFNINNYFSEKVSAGEMTQKMADEIKRLSIRNGE